MASSVVISLFPTEIKKESPNTGTETFSPARADTVTCTNIKKESPNKGTETTAYFPLNVGRITTIKKESPNKGTETLPNRLKLDTVSVRG